MLLRPVFAARTIAGSLEPLPSRLTLDPDRAPRHRLDHRTGSFQHHPDADHQLQHAHHGVQHPDASIVARVEIVGGRDGPKKEKKMDGYYLDWR